MEFCPKCGAILIQKKKTAGCPRCKYASKGKLKIEVKEKLGDKKQIAVIKEEDVEVLPLVEKQCPTCKNEKAYFWTTQTRSADEAETKFYRCRKCKHTWRDYK